MEIKQIFYFLSTCLTCVQAALAFAAIAEPSAADKIGVHGFFMRVIVPPALNFYFFNLQLYHLLFPRPVPPGGGFFYLFFRLYSLISSSHLSINCDGVIP